MQTAQIIDWCTIAALCLAAAGLARYWLRGTARPAGHEPRARQSRAVFLFDGPIVIDQSNADHVTPPNTRIEKWGDLVQVIRSRFPDFPATPDAVPPGKLLNFCAADPCDRMRITAEQVSNIVRVQFDLPENEGANAPIRSAAVKRLELELQTLRLAMNDAPYPLWQVLDSGEVSWHNSAYAALYETVHSSPPDPSKRLFQTALDDRATGSRVRSSITIAGTGQTLWFDVFVVLHDDCRMFYGVDINAVVNAEIAQRNFVQTLAKTFAQLSIGLAIFDRNRQLVLFNPALIDLTALPADFLTGRPNLLSFFDRLRDNRMMPEPKNYGSWRDQMAELVAAAADGRYQETWSLPSGSVYQVSGRPHPDGAVAFLIEDITAEVTLTRRFRSDLELGQSILDQFDDAIAVFSQSGVLTLSNAAYRSLWAVDPDSSFAEVTVLDATRDWQTKCRATPVWGDLRDFVISTEHRAEWEGSVTRNCGAEITCSVHPVQSGATLVRFRSPNTGPVLLPPGDARMGAPA